MAVGFSHSYPVLCRPQGHQGPEEKHGPPRAFSAASGPCAKRRPRPQFLPAEHPWAEPVFALSLLRIAEGPSRLSARVKYSSAGTAQALARQRPPPGASGPRAGPSRSPLARRPRGLRGKTTPLSPARPRPRLSRRRRDRRLALAPPPRFHNRGGNGGSAFGPAPRSGAEFAGHGGPRHPSPQRGSGMDRGRPGRARGACLAPARLQRPYPCQPPRPSA